jgi:uncharacterized protein (DUF1499 family)
VQLSVHFLKIGERPNIACHSPLERFPALEDMLPPGLGVEHYMYARCPRSPPCLSRACPAQHRHTIVALIKVGLLV